MTQTEVAKALGISKTWVQVLEYRAICKLAVAFGEKPPAPPGWMKQYTPLGEYGCRKCGTPGHNRRSCR